MSAGKKIDPEHLELVSAVIFGGLLSSTADPFDEKKLQPFIDYSIAAAKQLIESSRS